MARDSPKIPERQLFIGGEWCEPARGLRLPVINPATEESIGTIPAATAEDVERAVKAARDAFTRNKGKDWARTSGKYRAKYLRAIAAKVVEKKEELSRLEAIDCGKPYDEAAWDMKDGAPSSATMQDLVDAGILLPTTFPFKRIQLSERYPKGQARGRHWKHLKQMLQAENYHLYPADEPNYMNIEAPPSMYPAKKYCDISGFEAPYTDPRTKLHFANTDVFKQIRSLPNEYVQGYLALRNAQVVLK